MVSNIMLPTKAIISPIIESDARPTNFMTLAGGLAIMRALLYCSSVVRGVVADGPSQSFIEILSISYPFKLKATSDTDLSAREKPHEINVATTLYSHLSIKSGRKTRQPTHWKGAQTMWPDGIRRSGNQWESAPAQI